LEFSDASLQIYDFGFACSQSVSFALDEIEQYAFQAKGPGDGDHHVGSLQPGEWAGRSRHRPGLSPYHWIGTSHEAGLQGMDSINHRAMSSYELS
jgi:hypothetical protein